MPAKNKNSKKSTQVYQSDHQSEGNRPHGDTTILGISPRELGTVVAAAVIAEVSQFAVNKISQSVAQSNPKQKLQDQLNPISDSVKSVVGEVKDAIPERIASQIADVPSPALEASDTVESTLVNGQVAAADEVDRGVENAKEITAVLAGIAQEQAGHLIDGTRQKADQTRGFVFAQIENAIAGAQDTAGKTRHALGDTIDATQDTASATQKAVAQIIDEAVNQVKAVLAAGSNSSQGDKKPEKKGKKVKKHKKGK